MKHLNGTLHKIPKDFTGIVNFASGSERHYKNGKLHRLDGPAWVAGKGGGSGGWYIEGKCVNKQVKSIIHIDGGRELTCYDGTKYWAYNGNTYPTNLDMYAGMVEFAKANLVKVMEISRRIDELVM